MKIDLTIHYDHIEAAPLAFRQPVRMSNGDTLDIVGKVDVDIATLPQEIVIDLDIPGALWLALGLVVGMQIAILTMLHRMTP